MRTLSFVGWQDRSKRFWQFGQTMKTSTALHIDQRGSAILDRRSSICTSSGSMLIHSVWAPLVLGQYRNSGHRGFSLRRIIPILFIDCRLPDLVIPAKAGIRTLTIII